MHPPVHLIGPDNGQPSFLVFITRGLERTQVEASLLRYLERAGSGALLESTH
jgi:hypothetical protein